MAKVIILGAKGRFGRAAQRAFFEAGWDVTAYGRNWTGAPEDGVDRVEGDVLDAATLHDACKGQDVIVNAINPPYMDWAQDLPKITEAVIAAVRHSGATVLIPGNVYNYGADAPQVLTEATPWRPTSRKGQLRVEMERRFRDSGVRTVVLRAGDYVEREKSGNWFDSQIAVKAHQGRCLYPGPLDAVHAWAYLPDVARAAVMLMEKRDSFATFEEVGFEGYSLTGAEFVQEIGVAVGKTQQVSKLSWPLVWFMGIAVPLMREVYEMRYLWRVPHQVNGQKLARLLPDFQPTPIKTALKEVLAP